MIENFLTLLMLIVLQAVLGFDNLLYISLESKKAPENKQQYVRKLGIGLAIFLRIILLFLLISLLKIFQSPLFGIDNNVISGSFNFHSVIVLFGGVFIIFTAMKEIFHLMQIDTLEVDHKNRKSTSAVLFSIVLMNLIFSFDSILASMALTEVFWVMATAILTSGIIMMYLADKVSDFLNKNRMYEVLGLFILFVVGIMLVTEGGHLAHLKLFGESIEAMSKTTFYFVILIVVLNDIVQGIYEKRIRHANQSLNT